ncbi:cyclic nucleotide-binding domain-containing protein [Tardiphaga sp.]|uniref:Crp/Fnr family transcriptional regulator n=1 Tax=Tardiphaga sp. TaxID=1926292 RepID=UPI00260D04C7|nr:cyclic nucleotide-binding domain-containing protein [Tardiphaga sp.]MDB5616478.1 transcriptional regulator, Crp/Fnr family [Tardiphaga sp.]
MPQSLQNRLLARVPLGDFQRIRSHMQLISLDYRKPLYEANEAINSVYFLIEGVASLVNTMADGSSAEVGTIGNEGIVGIPIILGDAVAPTTVYMQVPGEGFRLDASILAEVMDSRKATRTLMLSYIHTLGKSEYDGLLGPPEEQGTPHKLRAY